MNSTWIIIFIGSLIFLLLLFFFYMKSRSYSSSSIEKIRGRKMLEDDGIVTGYKIKGSDYTMGLFGRYWKSG